MLSPQFRPIVGGYERACERLSIALAAQGHEVTVMAERRSRVWPAHEFFQGVELRRWWCVYQLRLHVLSSLLGFAGLLLWRGRRFDVWHVHQYGLHAALAVVFGGLLGRPVVLKLTSSAHQGLGRTLASSRLAGLMAYLHRRVDAVVALTRETAAEAEAFGIPKERIHGLGNGVDTNLFRPRSEHERQALRGKLGLGGGPVVVFVGRLSHEKNVAGLLLAWSQAQPRSSGHWRLVVVGEGPLRGDLDILSNQLQVGPGVKFVGQQSNVVEWLGASDIYVLSSFNEGLSNTLLEAMATGLPVVITHVSGSTELVQETGSGWVVDIEDMAGFANALLALMASEDSRRVMGIKARQVIEQRYGIGHVAAEHAMIYAGLVARRRSKNDGGRH